MVNPATVKVVFLLGLACVLGSCADQSSVNDYTGEWYGAVGATMVDSYRVTIELAPNPTEFKVRELDELNKPWVSPNALERLKLAGFNVEGGVPISMTWAGLGQANPEDVAEAFFLPKHRAEVGRGLKEPLVGAVTGRGFSAPLFFDAENDRLISSPFLPCFYRTVEQAKSESKQCLL